jgi:hypothetical protein
MFRLCLNIGLEKAIKNSSYNAATPWLVSVIVVTVVAMVRVSTNHEEE